MALTVEAEHGQKPKADTEWSSNVDIGPSIRASRPVQGQKEEGAGGDEEQRPDGIAGPDV